MRQRNQPITPTQLTQIERLAREEKALFNRSCETAGLFINLCINAGLSALFYTDAMQEIVLYIETMLSGREKKEGEKLKDIIGAIEKKFGLLTKETTHLPDVQELKIKWHEWKEIGLIPLLKTCSKFDKKLIFTNVASFLPKDAINLLRERGATVYLNALLGDAFKNIGLDDLQHYVVPLTQIAMVVLPKYFIIDPLSQIAFRQLCPSITVGMPLKKLTQGEAKAAIDQYKQNNAELAMDANLSRVATGLLCCVFVIYELYELVNDNYYEFNYFSILTAYASLTFALNIYRDAQSYRQARISEKNIDLNRMAIEKIINPFSFMKISENQSDKSYLIIAIQRSYGYLTVSETRSAISDILTRYDLSIQSTAQNHLLIVQLKSEKIITALIKDIIQALASHLRSLSDMANFDKQMKELCDIMANGYDCFFQNNARTYSIHLKNEYKAEAVSTLLKQFSPHSEMSYSNDESTLTLHCAQKGDGDIRDCRLALLNLANNIDLPTVGLLHQVSAHPVFYTAKTKSSKKNKIEKVEAAPHVEPAKNATIQAQPKTIEHDYKGKKYLFKQVAGTNHSRFFFASALTKRQFGGNHECEEKFRAFSEDPYLAPKLKGKEGMILNIKNKEMTHAAKIKFLGPHCGNVRVGVDAARDSNDVFFVAVDCDLRAHRGRR